MEIFKVEDLSFTYPACKAPAISGVSFSVERGEFVVLCGPTGSGKSTLLRALKKELAPLGDRSGRILFKGAELDDVDDRTSASSIGFVAQKPEQQLVVDKVWHELAFGLENLGVPKNEIARRVAEMAGYFGISPWYEADVSELSGGQKQLLNLASALVMRPEVLILDEPTAQLDPIAATDFISTLKRLNADTGLTIILAEHRLEDAIPACDRLMVMAEGRLVADAAPKEAIAGLSDRKELLYGAPAAARLYAELGASGECPLTVKEGRSFIESGYGNAIRSLPDEEEKLSGETALEFKDVFFRYSRDAKDVLKGLCLKVYSGEIFCVLGGNGSGKTTALRAAAGLTRPYAGTIKAFGKKLKEYKNRSLYKNCLAMLPQDVQTVFLKNTVREELEDCGADTSKLPFDLEKLMDKHPYDLSGGEQQLVALAKTLSSEPRLLLLDEPTKGLDAYAKREIMEVLRRLRAAGVTIVVVSHDVEFAAECADRCAMFFAGGIVSSGAPRAFFSESSFYTTAISRMTRDYYDGAVTVADAAELCRLNGRREL